MYFSLWLRRSCGAFGAHVLPDLLYERDFAVDHCNIFDCEILLHFFFKNSLICQYSEATILDCGFRKKRVDLCHYWQHFYLKSLDDSGVGKPLGSPSGSTYPPAATGVGASAAIYLILLLCNT